MLCGLSMQTLRGCIGVPCRWRLQAQNERLPPATRTSFPDELFRRIENSYGTTKAISICNILNEEAPTYLRTNALKITRDRLYTYLLNKGKFLCTAGECHPLEAWKSITLRER